MMNQTTYRARVTTALLFFILGLVTLWQSYDLPFGTLKRIKAGFFPTIFGGLMTGLSILMLVSLVLARRRDGVGTDEPESTEEEEPVNLVKTLAFTSIFILFVVLAYGVGFLAASIVSLAAAGYMLGLRSWRLMLLALVTTGAIWLIFDVWLGISLPQGVWL